MHPAPIPEDESRRIAALSSYELLDTAADAVLDGLTRTICDHLQVPISTITLVDRHRQWFKSVQGMSTCETAREVSFCGHAVYHEAPLVVEDARRDERFRDNPLVTGPPHIRFYAGVPLRGAHGLALGVVCAQHTEPRTLTAAELGFLHDMAAVAAELIELRRTERLLERQRQLFAAGPTVILRWGGGPDWPVQYASANLAEVFGYRPESLLGRPYRELIHPEERQRVGEELAAQLEQGVRRYEHAPYRFRGADGAYRWVHDVRLIEWGERGEVEALYGYLNDLTERVALEDQVHRQRFYDPRTGLPNRALFEERLDQAMAEARRQGRALAVLALDLRDFRAVNDSLGHLTGNEVLRKVGQRLRAHCPEADSVARLSGDEFGILVSQLSGAGEAAALAERIADAVEAPYEIQGMALPLNVRVGVHVCAAVDCSAEALLEQADSAMYEAKREGVRCRFFSPELTERAREQVVLAGELRHALAEGQLALHYQPQVELHEGAWVGVEALARWPHPERGWISPASFIPAAEQAGLVDWLGAWVLEQACAQGRAWLDAGRPLGRVAVNVAAPQLHNPELGEQVAAALARTGLPPAYLELEITESLMVSPHAAVVERLEALRRRGVRIAVDDFGTGYSALSYLKDLPIDRLKIDRSFVGGLAEQERMRAITRAIIALGRSLGYEVLAEGIETEREHQILLAEGCRYGQGFRFARPMPPQALSPGP